MSSASKREVSAVNPPDGGAAVRFVRRHPLVSFLLWAYTVGQVLPWSVMLTGLTDRNWLVQGSVLVSTLIGLLLPALIITRINRWTGRAPRPVGTGGGYAPRLGVVCGGPRSCACADHYHWRTDQGTPAYGSARSLLTGFGAHFLLPLLITFMLINWQEEVVWMGYVQARLQDRQGALLSALIVAPLIALQHSSLGAGHNLMAGPVMLVLLAALAVPIRFALGWAYNRTENLFLVGLVHAVGNAATGGDGFHAGYLRNLYPGDS